jgi:hypothetical protein
METKRIILLFVIVIILIICILLNSSLKENFTASSSRTLINDVDTLFFNHVTELDTRLEKEPKESTKQNSVDDAQFEGQANNLLRQIIQNINRSNINKINIELDTTDFGNKCINDKSCEKDPKTSSYKCFVRLKNNDFRVGRKVVKQTCDKLLNNTRNHVVNLDSFRLDNKEVFKNLLIKIDRVFNTYNNKLDLLIEKLKQKEDNIRQQSYFETNNLNMLYMNRKNMNKMGENIKEKKRNSNNNFALLEGKKERMKEYDTITTKFKLFSRVLLGAYCFILFIILSKKKIDFL